MDSFNWTAVSTEQDDLLNGTSASTEVAASSACGRDGLNAQDGGGLTLSADNLFKMNDLGWIPMPCPHDMLSPTVHHPGR